MGERLGEIYWIKMSFQQSFKTNHRFSSPDEESFPKLRMLQAQMGDYIWLYGKKVEQLQDLDQMMWDLGCTNRVSVALIYKQGPVSGALCVNNRILKQILKFTGSQWREKRIGVSAGSFLLTSFLLCSATAGYGLWRTKRCTWKHENSNQRRRKLKFKMTEWQQQFDFSNIFLDEGKKIGSAKRCRCVQNADGWSKMVPTFLSGDLFLSEGADVLTDRLRGNLVPNTRMGFTRTDNTVVEVGWLHRKVHLCVIYSTLQWSGLLLKLLSRWPRDNTHIKKTELVQDWSPGRQNGGAKMRTHRLKWILK